ncbi:hypothetical protein EPN28_04615 [Patescibacteria group bacterium]|nr:MAG: hypothetical protein EPN28_04615 [Patescibacteria group bacterium]
MSQTTQSRAYYGGIALFFLAVLIFALPSQIFFQAGVLGIIIFLVVIFLFNLRLGLYALAATSFFYGWEVVLAKYSWAKNIAYLSSVNAPMVDIIALALLFAVGVVLATRRWIQGQVRNDRWLRALKIPAILYAIFLVSAAVSAYFFAYDHNINSSLKYLARPMFFAFVAFSFLPVILIDSEKKLLTVLKIWFCVGTLTAIFGLASLVVAPQQEWFRVTPFSIGGFAPLGYNHNLIAEVLVAIIPLGIYLAARARQQGARCNFFVYAIGVLLMLLAEFLTLSRAGWVAIFSQIAMTLFLFRGYLPVYVREIKGEILAAGVLAVVFITLYMGAFLTSSIVSNSNSSRVFSTKIVLFYAARSPLFGYGPGMYIRVLGDTWDWFSEYGDPLEAHGFMQKILLEEGLVGLTLFLIFVSYLIYFLWKRAARTRDLMLTATVISVFGAIIFQVFNTSYFNSVMWMPIGVALAATGLKGKD